MSLHAPLAIALSVSLGWTVLFSLSNTPGVRGYRNLGILAAYVSLLVFLFRASWSNVAITWLCFAVTGGITYTAWEVVQRVRTPDGTEKPTIGFAHVFPAIAIWPLMLPEVVEYALAEFGVLKSSNAKKG